MEPLVVKTSMLIECDSTGAFDAFVDPDKITRFWLDATSAPLSDGATVTWHFMVPGATETVEVIAFERPRLLAFRWSDNIEVWLEFFENPSGETKVSLNAVGFSGEDAVAKALDATEGFGIVLCDLKTMLESGKSAGLVRAKAKLVAASLLGNSKSAA